MDIPPVEEKQTLFQEAHLRDYWKIVWQARWTVIAIFVVVVGLTAVWTFIQPRIYRATATIEIQPQANRLAAGQDVSGLGVSGYGWFAEEKYHNTQVEIIHSRKLAGKAFRRLHLDDHPSFSEIENREARIEAFRKTISAVPRRDTGLIEISVIGLDPATVTEWVNAVARTYVEHNMTRAQENVDQALTAITAQMEQFEDEVRGAEADRFEALQLSENFSSEDQGEIIRERLRLFNAKLNETQIELSRLSGTLERIRELQQSESDLLSIPELADDGNLRELLSDRIKLERALESAKVQVRPGHQLYQQTESELEKVKQRIRDRVSQILGTLQNRHDLAVKDAVYLREQIHAAEQQSVLVAQGRSSYELTKKRSETQKQIFDLIAKTLNEVQVGMQLMTNNVSMLDEASIPRFPFKPRRRVNLMVGAVLGMFLGVAAAFFLDYLDNTFRTPDDIEKHLGLSVLGVIPKMGQGGVADRAVQEAYQSLRTSVIFSSKNHRRKVILVTSSGPQEGKSSTVARLAQMLAAAGDRVIIVDCDLRRPVQHVIHEVGHEQGLTHYLAAPIDLPAGRGDVGWTDFVQTLAPTNLHLLPSGPTPPSPPELLGSERFTKLIAGLRESYDWVLIDSPPAASLADATVLASMVDMVMLVVRHAQTDRELVIKTVNRLRAVNPTIAGAVLNYVDIERAYHKDYYYAGAYYYSEEEERKTSKKAASKARVG